MLSTKDIKQNDGKPVRDLVLVAPTLAGQGL